MAQLEERVTQNRSRPAGRPRADGSSSGQRRSLAARLFLLLAFTFTALVIFQRPLIEVAGGRALALFMEAGLGLDSTGGRLRADSTGSVRLDSWRFTSESPPTPIRGLALERLSTRISWSRLLGGSLIPLISLEGRGLELVVDLSRPWPESADETEAPALTSVPPISISDSRLTLIDGDRTWEFVGIELESDGEEYLLRVEEARGLSASFVPDLSGLPLEVRGRWNFEEHGLESFWLEFLRLGRDTLAAEVAVSARPGHLEARGRLPILPGKGSVSIEPDLTVLDLRLEEVELEPLLRDVVGRFFRLPLLTGQVDLDLRARLPREKSPASPLTIDLGVRDFHAPDLDLRTPRLDLKWSPTPRGARGEIHLEELVAAGLAPVSTRITFEHLGVSESRRWKLPEIRVEAEGESLTGDATYDPESRHLELDLHLDVRDTRCSLLDFVTPLLAEATSLPTTGGALQAFLRYRGPVASLTEPRHSLEIALEKGQLEIEARFREHREDPAAWTVEPDSPLEITARIRSHDGELLVEEVLVERGPDRVEIAGLLSRREGGETFASLWVEGSWEGEEVRTPRPLALSLEDGELRVDPFSLEAFSGEIVVDTSELREEAPRVVVEARNIEVERLAALLPGEFVARGRLGARLELAAPTEADLSDLEAWQVEGRASLEEGRVVHERLKLEQLEARLEGSFRDRFLDLKSLVIENGSDRVSARGRVELPGPEAATPSSSPTLDLELEGEVSALQNWLPDQAEIRRVGGGLGFQVSVRGTAAEPVLGGSLSLHDLRASLPRNQGELTGIRGKMEIRDDRLVILEDIELQFRGEPITVRGEIFHEATLFGATPAPGAGDTEGLAPFPVSQVKLQVESGVLNLIPVRLAGDFRAYGAVKLQLDGPLEALRISGNLDLRRAFLFKRMEILAERNPLPLEYFSFDEPPLRDARFDIAIRCDNSFHVRNNLLQVSADVDLRLLGTGESPYFVGRIFADAGRVRLPSTTSLKIDQLLVELLAREPFNPHVQIKLSNRLRGYDVDVFVSGSFEQPEVTLSSFPPLERERLLILVTTGYTLTDINRTGAEKVAVLQAAKYLGFLIADAFSEAGEDPSFFDDFSLETEGARKVHGEDLIRLEYRLSDHFFLQGERDFYEDFNFNVGYRLEFR